MVSQLQEPLEHGPSVTAHLTCPQYPSCLRWGLGGSLFVLTKLKLSPEVLGVGFLSDLAYLQLSVWSVGSDHSPSPKAEDPPFFPAITGFHQCPKGDKVYCPMAIISCPLTSALKKSYEFTDCLTFLML